MIFYRKSVRFYTASPRSVTSSYPTLATRLSIHPRHSAAFYKVLNSNVWCYAALRGIRCAVVPIMGSAALSLGKEAFRRKSAIPICALALALCVFTDISNVVMIVAGVILALSIRAVKKTRGGQTA